MTLRPTTTRTIRELRDAWRRSVLPGLRGDVLDLGAGFGIAADDLSADVIWIALEPSRSALRQLAVRVEERPGSRLLHAAAEDIPLPDASVDAVIASTVLCSVRDQRRALAEVVRVLRPGGRLVYFEHVTGPPRSWTRTLQVAYRPISRVIDSGCDPARDTGAAIRGAGFRSVEQRDELAPGMLGSVDPLIEGTAIR
ncbi:class I SAM-dependent methyltransferase [Microbacterium sp. ASV49]|uniref:Class I SAM-dependent methyltransferase n=1 Tax=Microbacterium candidum TaxID=3041922 RepID=A0ABT7MX34_9MICO|nr:class I SAM-dependent methyltransferase [Microbacterium sp. ASV49]MDL9979009.1 class I SAM-dependent methyltransferase [Microbacterium sp. ASV49]